MRIQSEVYKSIVLRKMNVVYIIIKDLDGHQMNPRARVNPSACSNLYFLTECPNLLIASLKSTRFRILIAKILLFSTLLCRSRD